MQTVRESFETLEQWFRPEYAAGVRLTVEYRITGDGGGVWHALVADGVCTVGEGPPIAEPDMIVSAKAQDWLDFVSGNVLFPRDRLGITHTRTGWFPGIARLGLLGKEYPAPGWTRHHWFHDDLSILAYFAPEGELDHAAFRSTIEERRYVAVALNGVLGQKTLLAAVTCRLYRRECWLVGGLVVAGWVALALGLSAIPLILLGHWQGGLVAALLGFVWWWEAKRAATRALEKRALADEGFWKSAMEHGLLTVVSRAP